MGCRVESDPDGFDDPWGDSWEFLVMGQDVFWKVSCGGCISLAGPLFDGTDTSGPLFDDPWGAHTSGP